MAVGAKMKDKGVRCEREWGGLKGKIPTRMGQKALKNLSWAQSQNNSSR